MAEDDRVDHAYDVAGDALAAAVAFAIVAHCDDYDGGGDDDGDVDPAVNAVQPNVHWCPDVYYGVVG